MNPKSGKAIAAVAPKVPVVAEDADKADPGEAEKVKSEQIKSKSGKYGAAKTKPFKPPAGDGGAGGARAGGEANGGANGEATEEEDVKTSWIEIEMVGEDDGPIPGEAFEITVPDGTVASGTLDSQGWARVDGIDPGNCQITFPDIDAEAWDLIEAVGPKKPAS